jgi:hypothetical protein
MKNRLIQTGCMLLFSCYLMAQSPFIERVFDGQANTSMKCLAGKADFWVAGGSGGAWGQVLAPYFSITTDSSTIENFLPLLYEFEQGVIVPVEYGEIQDIEVLNDTSIYFVGWGTQCFDCVFTRGFLTRMSNQGLMYWQVNGNEFSDFKHIAIANQRIYIAYEYYNNNGIFCYSLDGDSLASYQFSVGKINDILCINDTQLIIAADSGISILDSNGNILHSYATAWPVQQLVYNDNKFLLKTNLGLFSTDTSFSTFNLVSAPQLSTIKGIASHNGKSVILGNNSSNDNPCIVVLDSSFAVLDSIVTNLDQATPISIALFDTSIAFIGLMDYARHSFLKTYSISGASLSKHDDIAVTNILVDSVTASGQPPHVTTTLFLQVEVTNFAAEEVRSFRLLSCHTPNCADGYFIFGWSGIQQTEHDSVVIPPGGTVIIPRSFKRIHTGPIYIIDACVMACSPNHRIDNFLPNNEYCTPFSWVNAQKPISISPFNIFPNPARHFIQLTLPADIRSYQLSIVDLFGRLVYQKECDDSNQIIELPDLAAGVYSVHVQSSDGRLQKTLIIGEQNEP